MFALQADGFIEFRIVQFLQEFRDLILHRHVQRAADGQIKPVEFVQIGQTETVQEIAADGVRRFLRDEGVLLQHRRIGQEMQRNRLRGGKKLRGNLTAFQQPVECRRNQLRERGMVAHQIIGRTTLRENEREAVFERFGFARQIVGAVAAVHRPDRFGQIDAEPRPQPIADAVDFAPARPCCQRRGVQVIEDNLFADIARIGAVLIGADAGRDHLSQLVRDAGGLPARRITEFFNLDRQRTAAADIETRHENTDQLPHHGGGEAAP